MLNYWPCACGSLRTLDASSDIVMSSSCWNYKTEDIYFDCYIMTCLTTINTSRGRQVTYGMVPRPNKKGTNSILTIIFTNLDNLHNFWHKLYWHSGWLKNSKKSPINTCTTLCNDDIIVASLKNVVFARRKRNARIHSTSTVASKFAGFKSSWLHCVGHSAREGVRNMHDWSWRTRAPHKNWVG